MTIFNTSNTQLPCILVAEDDEANLYYLNTLLKRANMKVVTATNGKEAVSSCQQNPEIRLVLMDIRMPEMDGLEATRTIKSFRNELPIIAVTAYALHTDEKKAREAGCDDYLTKPLSRIDLLDKIHRLLIRSENKGN
jgi:CheY-like chemotaxis protein